MSMGLKSALEEKLEIEDDEEDTVISLAYSDVSVTIRRCLLVGV